MKGWRFWALQSDVKEVEELSAESVGALCGGPRAASGGCRECGKVGHRRRHLRDNGGYKLAKNTSKSCASDTAFPNVCGHA